MKYTGFIVLLACSALVANAEGKLDLSGRMLIQNYKEVVAGADASLFDVRVAPAVSRAGGDVSVGVIVKLNNGFTPEDLANEGIVVVSSIDDMAVCSVPVDQLEKLAGSDAVMSVTAGELQQPAMFFARSAGMVDQVQQGEGLEQSYTGAGVVVGAMDEGLDPNHINFMTGTDYTTPRVKAFYAFTGNNGVPTKLATTPGEVLLITTDTPGATHGTHVMGIAGGSYNGPSQYGIGGRVYDESPMPYYGVAPESDLVMSGGVLYDANIVAGVQKVIEYAEAHNQPAVVNLSLGSILGPHDGSDATCQYLDKLGERGVICVAAGNDGDYNCAASIRGGMTEKSRTNNAIGFALNENSSKAYTIQFWSNSASEFAFDFVVYDALTKSVVYEMPVANLNGKSVAVGGSSLGSSYEKNDFFSEAFTDKSYFTAWSQVQDGRYLVQAQCILNRDAYSNTLYTPAIRVTRVAGQAVYAYINSSDNSGTFTVQTDKTGWTGLNWSYSVASADGSISSMATGKKVISVGAFTSSRNFTTLAGTQLHYTDAVDAGKICTFSSYGSNPVTGETYPMICAPGSAIVSSLSTFYTASDNEKSGLVPGIGRQNLWGAMQGTSMACPFVTGTVALMLQANPDMGVGEVSSILKAKAASAGTTDTAVLKRWGAGKIDALAAVKETIERKNSGIDNILVDIDGGWIIRPVGNKCYEVTVDGASTLSATLYNLQGGIVATATGSAGAVTLDAQAANAGVYILSVTAPNMKPLSRKLSM